MMMKLTVEICIASGGVGGEVGESVVVGWSIMVLMN